FRSLYNQPLDDHDVLEITNIDFRNLWLHQNNEDLIVSILGTSDQVTVKDWFAADDDNPDENELDAIRVVNGSTTKFLENNQASINTDSGLGDVDQFDRLIQAMADFGAAPSAGWADTLDSQAEVDLHNIITTAWS